MWCQVFKGSSPDVNFWCRWSWINLIPSFDCQLYMILHLFRFGSQLPFARWFPIIDSCGDIFFSLCNQNSIVKSSFSLKCVADLPKVMLSFSPSKYKAPFPNKGFVALNFGRALSFSPSLYRISSLDGPRSNILGASPDRC